MEVITDFATVFVASFLAGTLLRWLDRLEPLQTTTTTR